WYTKECFTTLLKCCVLCDREDCVVKFCGAQLLGTSEHHWDPVLGELRAYRSVALGISLSRVVEIHRCEGFSKKVNNGSENGTTIRVLTTPKPTKSNGFIEGTKTLWEKAKKLGQKVWTKTTPPPKRNVWIVPVDWRKLYATRSPCSEGINGQGCLSSSSSSQLAGVSWWTLSLSLMGAMLMGIGAWVVFRRRWPGAGSSARDSITVRPPKLPWPWYPSGPDCTAPRGPGAFPQPPAKTTGGPLSAVTMSAGPPPSWPAPPVPAPASNRANSLYHATPAAARNVYATPTPHSAWPAGANEHVHIYEIPPYFPSFDLADQEIDTTALKKPAFDTKQAKC
ncbi:Protein of unknown function, partial [Gryllus bimaculatus]